MNIAILDVRKGSGRVPDKSHTVAYRNLCVLRDELGADLFVNAADIKFNKMYNVIICGFGSTSCEKERSVEFLKKNTEARIFWLVGEYEQSTFAPLFYSKRDYEVIKNFKHTMKGKHATKQHFININALLTKPQQDSMTKKYDCIYYGRWRKGRVKYFKKYLDGYIYLSTAMKNFKLFFHNGCKTKNIKPLKWGEGKDTLGLFNASLYIEDEYTHTHFNNLGNRFYEALWCGTVPLFDSSCLNTLRMSDYDDYEWHIVNSPSDVKKKCAEIKKGNVGMTNIWSNQAEEERVIVISKIKQVIGYDE